MQLMQLIPADVRSRSPEPRLLRGLEKYSAGFVFGETFYPVVRDERVAQVDLSAPPSTWTTAPVFGPISTVLAASGTEEFESRLEGLAKSGEADKWMDALFSLTATQPAGADAGWTLIHAALRDALGGTAAANVFTESLSLFGMRMYWAARADRRNQSPNTAVAHPQTPDPFIWGRLHSVDKGDACFVVAIYLLASRSRVSEWMGLLIAEIFREGQAAGVQLFASIFSGEEDEAERALAMAGMPRIDWHERWKTAHRIDAVLDRLMEKWEDRSVPFSPFGDVDGYEEEPSYDDDDDDDDDERGSLEVFP